MVLIREFRAHREYDQVRRITFSSLSALLAAYPLIFRNKGCSLTSEWGKVTVRPLGLGLLAGLLNLAGNARWAEDSWLLADRGPGWEGPLLAATEQKMDIQAQKSGLRLENVSGGWFFLIPYSTSVASFVFAEPFFTGSSFFFRLRLHLESLSSDRVQLRKTACKIVIPV